MLCANERFVLRRDFRVIVSCKDFLPYKHSTIFGGWDGFGTNRNWIYKDKETENKRLPTPIYVLADKAITQVHNIHFTMIETSQSDAENWTP